VGRNEVEPLISLWRLIYNPKPTASFSTSTASGNSKLESTYDSTHLALAHNWTNLLAHHFLHPRNPAAEAVAKYIAASIATDPTSEGSPSPLSPSGTGIALVELLRTFLDSSPSARLPSTLSLDRRFQSHAQFQKLSFKATKSQTKSNPVE